MPTNRQINFLAEVAEAARSIKVGQPRGKPTPANLTEEGRERGLRAMQKAPRCRSKRKDGQSCKKAAMRGATRCATHGGRMEVPDHPSVIKRFMSGKMHEAIRKQEAFMEGKEVWESMTHREQRELLNYVPERVRKNSRKLYEAAIVWNLGESVPNAEKRRRWLAVCEGK